MAAGSDGSVCKSAGVGTGKFVECIFVSMSAISYPESSGSLVSGLVARRDSLGNGFFPPEIMGSGCCAHA